MEAKTYVLVRSMFSIIRTSHIDFSKSQSKGLHQLLFKTIEKNNFSEFSNLLTENKKFPCIKFENGEFPIHTAARLNRVEMVKFLLKRPNNKSSLALKTDSGDSIWHIALINDCQEILELLFGLCPIQDCQNQRNQSVLDLAINVADETLIHKLLDKGFKRVDLFAATANTSIFTLIIKSIKGVNLYELDKNGRSLLHFACSNNNGDLVRALLLEGLDVNAIDQNGMTPLHSAISTGNLNLVAFLVTNGAVLKLATKFWTPSTHFAPLIHEAIMLSNFTIISYLIKQGVNLNDQDSSGSNAINFASSLNPKICDILLGELIDGGSDPSIPNQMGISALQNLRENIKMSTYIFNTGKYMKCFEIPTVEIAKNILVGRECCLICKSAFEETDFIYNITCDHKYHVECLNEWFKTMISCPLCNEVVVKIKSTNYHKKKFRLWK